MASNMRKGILVADDSSYPFFKHMSEQFQWKTRAALKFKMCSTLTISLQQTTIDSFLNSTLALLLTLHIIQNHVHFWMFSTNFTRQRTSELSTFSSLQFVWVSPNGLISKLDENITILLVSAGLEKREMWKCELKFEIFTRWKCF